MHFLDGIVEKENRFVKRISMLKKEGLPCYIFGSGLGGEQAAKRLESYGIICDGKVVNRRYWMNGSSDICLEDLLNQSDKPVNLIVAFRGYSPDILAGYEDKINEVINMDCYAGIYWDGDEEDNIYTYDWVKKNEAAMQSFLDTLEDDLSKETLFAYLNQKISWDYKYMDKVKQPYQYFDEKIYKMSKNEVFVDCGAYDGDSAMEFINALHRRGIDKYDEIISFEPDPDNFAKLKARNLEKHTCVLGGVSYEAKELHFTAGNNSGRFMENGKICVKTFVIDHVPDCRKATMIKMDIEGAELDALHGAENIIVNNKPLLAICIYHRKKDLLTIPEYIKSLVPEYRLFLRAYDETATELVLYAVC